MSVIIGNFSRDIGERAVVGLRRSTKYAFSIDPTSDPDTILCRRRGRGGLRLHAKRYMSALSKLINTYLRDFLFYFILWLFLRLEMSRKFINEHENVIEVGVVAKKSIKCI